VWARVSAPQRIWSGGVWPRFPLPTRRSLQGTYTAGEDACKTCQKKTFAAWWESVASQGASPEM